MSFLTHSLQTGLVRFVTTGLSMSGGVVVARWLGPDGVGAFALLNAVSVLAFRFGNLGFGSSFSYFVAKRKEPPRLFIHLAWKISLAVGAVSCLVLLPTWRLGVSPWRDIPSGLFYLCLATIPIYFLTCYSRSILSGMLRVSVLNVSEVVSTFCFVPAVLLLVVALDMGLVGAVLAQIAAQVAALAFLTYHLRKSMTGQDRQTGSDSQFRAIRGLWSYGRWNYLNMLANGLFDQMPLMFVKYFTSNHMVGLFSMARNIAQAPKMAVDPFEQMLFPYTAQSSRQAGTERTNRLCRVVLAMELVMVAVVALIARPLVLCLYGRPFLPAVDILRLLMFLILPYTLSRFLLIHVSAQGSPRVMFATNALGVVVALVLLLVLVPKFGPHGAAASVVALYSAMAVMRLAVYHRQTGARVSQVLLLNLSDLRLGWEALSSVRAGLWEWYRGVTG